MKVWYVDREIFLLIKFAMEGNSEKFHERCFKVPWVHNTREEHPGNPVII